MKYRCLLVAFLFFSNVHATFWLNERSISMKITQGSYFPGEVFTTFSFDIADTTALADSPDASIITNLFGDASDGGCLIVRITKLMDIKTNMWNDSSMLGTKGASFLFFGNGALDYRSNLVSVNNGTTMVLFPAPKAYSRDSCGFGGFSNPTPTDVSWGMTTNYAGAVTVLTTPSNNDPTGSSPGIEVVNPNEQHYVSGLDENGNAMAAFSGQDKKVYVNERISGSWNGQSVARYTTQDSLDSVRSALDDNGNALVTFVTSSDGSTRDAIKALYRNGGTWNAADVIITSASGVIQSHPFLAMDQASGQAFALWRQAGAIFSSLFDGNWKTPQKISSSGNLDATNYVSEPIAMNNNGQAFAVWVDSSILMGSFYNGVTWESSLQISAPGHSVVVNTISVSLDDMGNAVAGYQDNASKVPYSVFM